MEMKNIRIFAQWTSTRKNIDIGEKYYFTLLLLYLLLITIIILVKDKKILFKRIHTYEQSTIYVLNYFGIRIVNTHVEQKRGKRKTP